MKARHHLEKCQLRHRERIAAIQVEEDMLAASKPAEAVAADVASKALTLLEWLQELPEETFQNHDLNFKVAVQDIEIATHRAQQMLKVDLRTAPDAFGDMDTDDEHEPS